MKFDIEDMRQFADRHRGKYKKSGPHWSTILRFPVLFDAYEEMHEQNKLLLKLNSTLMDRDMGLSDYISKMVIETSRLREMVRWRKYPDEKPDTMGQYWCELLDPISGKTWLKQEYYYTSSDSWNVIGSKVLRYIPLPIPPEVE